jgi:hypothetical protein
VGGIGLIWLASAPLLYPRYRPDTPAAPTPADMFAYEHRSGAIGTTSFGEYLPLWVTQIPRESPLEAGFLSSQFPARLAEEYLPASAAIDSAAYGFNTAALTIASPQPFRAVFHTFYFPGWQATVDGRSIAIAPFSERGLISLDMPGGRHRLELSFQETPLRRAANVISGLALLVTLGWWGWNWRVPPTAEPATRRSWPGLSRRQGAIIAGVGLLAVGGKLLWLDRFDTPFKHTFDGTHVAQAQVETGVNFGDQINLLGYSLKESTLAPGQTLQVTAYWRAIQPLAANFSAFAQLVDDKQHLFAGQDNLHPGTIPTGAWQPWSFTADSHALTIPWGLPPGEYRLALGLYTPDDWRRLPVVNGQPGWADSWPLTVTITAAPQPPSLAELGIGWPVSVQMGPELRLLGATPERDRIVPGDFLRVALFWEALAAPGQNYVMAVRLVDSAGRVVTETESQPSFNRYPTQRWTAGERVRDDHALWIPADFPPGRYTVQVQVRDETGSALKPWLAIGELAVQ